MRFPVRHLLIGLLCAIPAQRHLCAQSEAASNQIKTALENRIAQNPDDATAWRLVGRLNLERQEVDSAIEACGKAVELSPESASGHFDLARALLANEDEQTAAVHFAEVIALAPDSDYGVEAATFLETLSNDSNVVPPRSDLQPNRFGGTPLNATVEQKTWTTTLDIGAAYNSNVQLAPIQRDSITPGLASAQFFLAPQFEARLLKHSDWDAGLSFNGYFTFNEGHLQQFDLEDYQPGAFVQFFEPLGMHEMTLRTQYTFSLNQFQGETFGNRHAITTSLNFDREDYSNQIYWTVDHSDFSDDGSLPSQTSLDGWTNTIGGSHTVYGISSYIDLVRGGIDFQLADLTGNDFNYRGFFAYLETASELPGDFWLTLQMGGGYRQYPNFVGDPSRNETISRASAELSRDLTQWCTLTAFSTFDRFASQNDLFDAERFYAGLMTTIRR